jgi:hypothetical protein
MNKAKREFMDKYYNKLLEQFITYKNLDEEFFKYCDDEYKEALCLMIF